MLILLPPSEGKAVHGDGPPLDPAALTLPEIAQAREEVMARLHELCRRPEEDAREILGLSAAQGEAVRRNRALTEAPTLRAADLYTGVLYDRLALPGLLDSAAADRTAESVLIFSGLWGVLAPGDRVPPYRLSMAVRLPGAGPLGAFWRAQLSDLLEKRAEGRVVVDCRSSTYAAAWRPRGTTAERTVSVRVLRETGTGAAATRSVVSHMAKAARGAVAHSLLAEGADPRTPAEVAESLNGVGYTTELHEPDRRGRPWTLDIIERA
ncbi:peroxide stress protein YaaA [Streptomonospora algeriensis]|uniref:Peroxide stress protein YaaA n=1 Tax=Streptomonospora algeriensis TaxID=995084 RepID=A0ABW3BB35_9ACTN